MADLTGYAINDCLTMAGPEKSGLRHRSLLAGLNFANMYYSDWNQVPAVDVYEWAWFARKYFSDYEIKVSPQVFPVPLKRAGACAILNSTENPAVCVMQPDVLSQHLYFGSLTLVAAYTPLRGDIEGIWEGTHLRRAGSKHWPPRHLWGYFFAGHGDGSSVRQAIRPRGRFFCPAGNSRPRGRSFRLNGNSLRLIAVKERVANSHIHPSLISPG